MPRVMLSKLSQTKSLAELRKPIDPSQYPCTITEATVKVQEFTNENGMRNVVSFNANFRVDLEGEFKGKTVNCTAWLGTAKLDAQGNLVGIERDVEDSDWGPAMVSAIYKATNTEIDDATGPMTEDLLGKRLIVDIIVEPSKKDPKRKFNRAVDFLPLVA